MLYSIDLRWRLAAFALWAVAGSLTQSLIAAGAFAAVSLLTAAQAPPRVLLLRVAAVVPFLLLVVAPLALFGAAHEALIIVLKALGILLAGLGFTAGAKQAEVLTAARGLGLPAALLHVMVIAERFAFHLYHDFSRMRVAGRVRGFRHSALAVRSTGNALGALTVRALDRSNRVGHALSCRGFPGVGQRSTPGGTSMGDVVFLVTVVATAAGILWLDRWWQI